MGYRIDNDVHYRGSFFSFIVGPHGLKEPVKYRDIMDTAVYPENEIKAFISSINGMVHFEVPQKSEIEYNWERKYGGEYIRLGIKINENNSMELPVDMNCYISKLLDLWEYLADRFPALYIKDAISGDVYTFPAFLEEKAELLYNYYISEYGIFKQIHGSRSNSVDDFELVEKTDVIKLQKDVKFGIRFVIDLKTEKRQRIEEIIIHPLLKNPDSGKESTKNKSYSYCSGMFEQILYYYFLEDWEMKQGKWIFKIIHKEKVLVEKEFTCIENV